MWYNEIEQTRGNVITFSDGVKISSSDADKSPFRDWEWHDEEPQWWIDLHRDVEDSE